MKVAIYARVSTTDQDCEMQLRELREYCERRGWEIFGEFVDTGFSGSKASRPALDRLKRDARLFRFNCVLVWKLDRWGRSISDSLAGIQELVSLGIRWVAITQNLDTDESNPMSRFMLHVMAAFAELEREMIRERTKAGVKSSRAKGTKWGRPERVFKRDLAAEMRSAGISWRAIAKELGVPFTTVRTAVKGVLKVEQQSA